MKIDRRIFVGLILLALLASIFPSPIEPAHADGPWYVSPSGNDSDNCLTTDTPCLTMNGAIGKATAGDTIFVETGTYTDVGDEVIYIDRNITISGGWNPEYSAQIDTSIIPYEQ